MVKNNEFSLEGYNIDGSVIFSTPNINSFNKELNSDQYDKISNTFAYNQHNQCFIKLIKD